MKNLITIFTIFLMFSTTIFSQISFGLKSGVNYSNIDFNSGIETIDQVAKETTKPKLGYHIGAFLQIPFSEKLAFKPEFLFSTQGQKVNFESNALQLNYLKVPLLIEYRFIEKLGIQFGPTIGYLLAAKSKVDGNSFDAKDFYNNSLDVGISGGLFWQLTNHLRLNATYYHGLNSISKDLVFTDAMGLPIAEPAQYQNRVLQIGVMMFFK